MTASGPTIKLSAPATGEFWEIPVLFEDEHLLAVAKPARLLSSPDRYDAARPNLMRLLHDAVAAGKPWARERGLNYLANAHRLDFETTGVFLLAKHREALVVLANDFGSGIPQKTYLALVEGSPPEDRFSVDVKLAQDEVHPGRMRWTRDGKKSLTHFQVVERFAGVTLLSCHPVTGRTHQIRVHLKYAGHSIYGDEIYGRAMQLWLSSIKPGYRLKPGAFERPLTPSLALHAWKLELPHPVTRQPLQMEAPMPRDLQVALKYLRKYALAPSPAKRPGIVPNEPEMEG
jgi:23S rRNA pseudouridine1911/1915/1917 synthase